MAKYIQVPFAENGDKVVIPDDAQIDGGVSYDAGYTNFYEKDPSTDATAKRIERTKMNQFFNDVSSNIKQWQEQSYPDWISDKGDGSPFAYGIGAIVRYSDGIYYKSIIANNNGEPTLFSGWDVLDSGDGIKYVVVTSNYTASINDYLKVNTLGGSFTVTLPTASEGEAIQLTDMAGSFATNNLIVAPAAGDIIMGLPADEVLNVDINYINMKLRFLDNNWRIE